MSNNKLSAALLYSIGEVPTIIASITSRKLALSQAGIQIAPNATLSFCATCARTKMDRTSLPSRPEETKATTLWEVVGIDLGGPETKSTTGHRYPIFFTRGPHNRYATYSVAWPSEVEFESSPDSALGTSVEIFRCS